MTASTSERRDAPRGRFHLVADAFYRIARAAYKHAHSFGATLGILLLIGALLAFIATWGFTNIAEAVMEGETQAFDERVLRWMEAHQVPLLEQLMVEVTMLGTWIVVLTVVGVSGLFLYLSKHKYSALLLIVATTGGIVLNSVLKFGFDRPRPQVFEWGTHVSSSSFPSGHSMSSVVVFGTVAYLAARLQKSRWARWLTLFVFGIIIASIAFSRLYLGVHYPSDVAGGMIVGLAWAAFCVATLEGIQRFARRNAKEMMKHEALPPAQK
jgi:undecaprenyl-diphosphatase